MNRERAIYFAGLMEEYLNIPSCVCENIENELINEKYNKVINYVIDRRKELENKANYKTHQEIINMYLELQQEKEQLNSLVNSCQEEIRRLKKQLEENKDKINWYENFEINKTIDKLRIKHNNQQKEFIEYLEDKIYSIEPKGTGINYYCEYDSEEDYISAMKEQSKLNTLKEILSKYREIIGVSDENN